MCQRGKRSGRRWCAHFPSDSPIRLNRPVPKEIASMPHPADLAVLATKHASVAFRGDARASRGGTVNLKCGDSRRARGVAVTDETDRASTPQTMRPHGHHSVHVPPQTSPFPSHPTTTAPLSLPPELAGRMWGARPGPRRAQSLWRAGSVDPRRGGGNRRPRASASHRRARRACFTHEHAAGCTRARRSGTRPRTLWGVGSMATGASSLG